MGMGFLEVVIVGLVVFPILFFLFAPSRVPSAPGTLFLLVACLLLVAVGTVGYFTFSVAESPTSYQTDDAMVWVEEAIKWL